MSTPKMIGIGIVVLLGAAASVFVYVIVSGNKVKNDVQALKGWKPPEGISVERAHKSKKLGKVKEVLEHKEAAVPHLVEAVKSWAPAEAVGAMIALAMLKAPEGLQPLIDALKKDEGEGGRAAAAALGVFGQDAAAKLKELAGGLMELTPGIRKNAYRAFAWTHEDSLLEPLSRGLSDPDASAAFEAADLLSNRKHKSLVAPLLAALASQDGALSSEAAKGLVHNKDEVDPAEIEKLLSSDKPHVAANALLVLGRLERSTLSLKIAPYVEDPRELVAAAAAEALLDSGGKLDPAKVIKLLRSEDPAVVEKTVQVLKRANAVDGKDQYVDLLKSGGKHSKKAGIALIAMCAKSEPGSLLDDPAVPALIELLKETDLAEAACETLKVYTRNHNLIASYRDWAGWWERYRDLETRLKEARGNYNKVKEWNDSGEIRGRAHEAVDMLNRALEIFEEIDDKKLSKTSYDNECQKIQMLLRQVSTLTVNEDEDEDENKDEDGDED